MAESITTITDSGQFEELFKKYFANRDVYLKTKSGDLKIQFLGYGEGNVAFRIPRVKNAPETVVTLAHTGDSTIYASLKTLERNEDTFIFLPLKIQVVSEKRSEERTSLETSGGKKVLFVSNLISESMIKGFLDSNEKKVSQVKERIAEQLKANFELIRVVFINETSIDVRMKYFLTSWAPLFVKDLKATPKESEARHFNFYINEIYAKDYKLSGRKEFVSEVSVPFVLRNMIPYGYIQVNNSTPMTENHLTVIKRLATMINDYFLKVNLFVPSAEKFIVMDISGKGLGIVFRDRRLLRYFQKNSQVILDIALPDGHRVGMGVAVRNTIFNEGGSIKVGLEIVHIDALSEVIYEEFLQSI